MKKLLAILLALTCVLSLIACGAAEQTATEPVQTDAPTQPTTIPTDAPTEPTEPTTIPTEPPTETPTEAPTEAPTEKPTQPDNPDYDKDGDGMIDGYEPITPTQKPTQKPTQAPTQKPTQKPTVSDHNHDMRLRTTIRKATHDKEGLDEVRCTLCSYTIQEVTPKINVPYLVDIELVSHERPNECYFSDGTSIMERIYGTDYCQAGDILTYKVIMSDGGSEGFTVTNECPENADVEVNGNLITVRVTQQRFGNDAINIDIISNDIDNNWTMQGIFTYIVLGDYKFTDLSGASLYVCLRDYITNNGMESSLWLLNEFNSGELVRYTKHDPSLSISGTAKYGYDDYLILNQYDDWLKTYFDLIDAYKARGFTKVYMDYQSGMSDDEGGYSDIIVFMAC